MSPATVVLLNQVLDSIACGAWELGPLIPRILVVFPNNGVGPWTKDPRGSKYVD